MFLSAFNNLLKTIIIIYRSNRLVVPRLHPSRVFTTHRILKMTTLRLAGAVLLSEAPLPFAYQFERDADSIFSLKISSYSSAVVSLFGCTLLGYFVLSSSTACTYQSSFPANLRSMSTALFATLPSFMMPMNTTKYARCLPSSFLLP